MKINVALPFDRLDEPEEFVTPEAVLEVARLVETLGFDAGCVTDHPCPTSRWLDAGGHYAQDPFVMLSLVAAATSRLRLQTGILVLPYRNPFVTARAAATLDVFSRGRLTLGLGAGYLKGEYRALGVDFERRNDIMDDYLKALKLALSGEHFSYAGMGYEALGNRIKPGPVQKPHPPLLVGGNSKQAIRRAVELADGWYPFFTGYVTRTARTAAMNDENDLAAGLAYLRELCERTERAHPPQIVVSGLTSLGERLEPSELIDKIGTLASMGVHAVGVGIEGRTRQEWCDNAARIAADVLPRLPKT